MELNKKSVTEFLEKNYNEDQLVEQVDEVIPDYLDDDWEDEYEDEHEAYLETGRGEAESHVIREIEMAIIEAFDVSYEEYETVIGENIWDTIKEVYDVLDVD